MTVIPSLGNLRLARLSDVQRLGLVGASGAFFSNWFAYERPGYKSFVEDTLSSYCTRYEKQILDPRYVVLVAEDTLEQNEKEAVYDELKAVYPPFEGMIPDEDLKRGKGIVGLFTVELKKESKFIGKFQTAEPDSEPKIIEKTRDQDLKTAKNVDEKNIVLEKLWAPGHIGGNMVIHPAYSRRGHGTELIQYVIKLAEIEKLQIAMSSSKDEAYLFRSCGFEDIAKKVFPASETSPDGCDAWLQVYFKSSS